MEREWAYYYHFHQPRTADSTNYTFDWMLLSARINSPPATAFLSAELYNRTQLITFLQYISLQGTINRILPLVIMGTFSCLGGIAALFLPETLWRHLPNTLQQGENFGSISWSNIFRCPKERWWWSASTLDLQAARRPKLKRYRYNLSVEKIVGLVTIGLLLSFICFMTLQTRNPD